MASSSKTLQGPERKGPVLYEERLLKTTPVLTSIPKCRKINVMVLNQRSTRSVSLFNETSKKCTAAAVFKIARSLLIISM